MEKPNEMFYTSTNSIYQKPFSQSLWGAFDLQKKYMSEEAE